MNGINITPAIQKIAEIVDSHKLADGVYCRFSEIREPNPYGTTDAANILYSIGHMAGSFHYLFNHEHAHMPLRYPDKVIDSCIELWDNNSWELFAKSMGFIDIDWVFCMTRAMQQTCHRWDEAMVCLEQAAQRMTELITRVGADRIKNENDLHAIFGTVCCLAELQRALRGRIITEKPLKLVLDRRPFI